MLHPQNRHQHYTGNAVVNAPLAAGFANLFLHFILYGVVQVSGKLLLSKKLFKIRVLTTRFTRIKRISDKYIILLTIYIIPDIKRTLKPKWNIGSLALTNNRRKPLVF